MIYQNYVSGRSKGKIRQTLHEAPVFRANTVQDYCVCCLHLEYFLSMES